MAGIGVGLIGYGIAGAAFHAPVIAAVDTLCLRTVVTSRADEVARAWPGVAVVADSQAVFADPAIALVVIASPNPTHADLARAALRAGKHVVIDKPMTTTTAEADELIALAREHGRVLSVYHNRRWDADFLTLRRLLDDGRLGHVFAYEAHFDRFRPAIKPGWRERPQPGSGLLFDLGSHLIDQALVLFGMPQAVTADVYEQRADAQVDDYFHLVLRYPRRRAILHASTIVRAPGPRFAVHGDGGSFVKYGLDGQEDALRAGRRAGGPEWGRDDPAAYGTFTAVDGTPETIVSEAGDYPAFYREVAAAIAGKAPPPVTARAGRDVIALIELARRSAAEGRTLAI